MLSARTSLRALRNGLKPGDAGATGFAAAALGLDSLVGAASGPAGPATAAAVGSKPCAVLHRGFSGQDSASALASSGSDHPHHAYATAHRPHHEHAPHQLQPNPQKQQQQHAIHSHIHHQPAHHPHMHKRHGHRPPSPPSDLLTALGEQHGVGDSKAFILAVHKLPVVRQQALLENTDGVAQYLQGLGVGGELLGRMLQHCPALFSFPAEERAAVLMGELMGDNVRRSAGQAAELFVRCPALANTRHVMPSIAKLVAAHHGDD